MKKVVSGHGPPNTCYNCGTSIADWTGVDGVSPSPGDYSVCTTCCAVLEWSQDDGKFVEPSDTRKAEIERYPDVRNVVALIKRIAQAQDRFDDDDGDDEADNDGEEDDRNPRGAA